MEEEVEGDSAHVTSDDDDDELEEEKILEVPLHVNDQSLLQWIQTA